MTDLLEKFEAADVDPAEFGHETHVQAAWLLLNECSLLDGIARYSRALRRLTAKLGIPGKYHETLTWFFMIMIAERQAACPEGTWEGFKSTNPDLLVDAGKLIGRYYSNARLQSAEARQVFLLPDLPVLLQGDIDGFSEL